MHLESLRAVLALAVIRDLDVIQFDITLAHLHGALKEEVYMEQPEGYHLGATLLLGRKIGCGALRRAYTG